MKFGEQLNNYFRGGRLGVAFALLLGCFLCSVAQTALGQTPKFTSPVTYPAGHPYVVNSGDFNRDGKMDLVAGDITTNDLVVLLGNGDGTLRAPLTYHQNAAPYYVIVSDFNRDEKLDLATANPNAATVSIFFGKGDGSFEAPTVYPVSKFPGRILAADFNRDGWQDLALNGGNSDIDILLNNGNGTFQSPAVYLFPEGPAVLAAGDYDRDGKIDLITTQRIAKTVNVLLGNGDGTFKAPISSTTNSSINGSGALSVVARDFDRDGKLDVAISDENLKILLGNGDGTFKPPSFTVRLINTSADLKPADFDGDGRIDLVSSGVFASGALEVLMGKGDGTFQDLGNLMNGKVSVSISPTDLNGDTRPDLCANVDGQLAVALVNITPGDPDNTDYFVNQHYLDFLDREPDANGFAFWGNEISSCGSNQQCVNERRINVSAAFYLSIEFQRTGYLVERLYKTAYGDASGSSTQGGAHQLAVPIIRRDEFLRDTQEISEGVIVNESEWQTVLENNQQRFLNQFVQRARFIAAYPTSVSPAQFVDQLNSNAGNVLSVSERANAIGLFGSATDTSNLSARAAALRQVAEDQDLYNAEFNRAFVLTQYFGYLRRNPNEGQDTDFSGYEFWLTKLNTFNGNFVAAEMVKSFIASTEYRNRFTQ